LLWHCEGTWRRYSGSELTTARRDVLDHAAALARDQEIFQGRAIPSGRACQLEVLTGVAFCLAELG